MADETITQDKRLLAVTTPLGKDVLLLDQVNGSEAVSQLFQFDVTMVATRANGNDGKVDPGKLLGKSMTLAVTLADGKQRFVNGIVRRFRKGEVSQRFATFRAELVPTLWLLSLKANCRIFQGLSIPDVIQQLLKEGGVEFKANLTGQHKPADFCVQYRETDLNFVCRLMEEVGIFYWFEHTDSGHTMMLADAASAHKDCPNQPKAFLDTDTGSTDQDFISAWEERQELNVGKWTLRDYHFELPRKDLEVSATAIGTPAPVTKLEMFDYPGGYAQHFNKPGERLAEVSEEGDTLVAIRMAESDAGRILIEASSNCRALIPGFKISVDSRSLQTITGSFILTSLQTTARQSPSYTGGDDSGGAFANNFACVPARTVLRPPRETPRPVVQGLQHARVVDEGEPGAEPTDEISPDKFGRVRVLFPWDREGKAACRVRVAQVRAGKSGGQIWIPRSGDEVVVAFIEGNPDCPLIVGSLYNADNMPPYALPANKTQSGIKTRSSAKAGADEFNELRFEDKKDAEEILLHAQKQLTVEVEADESRTVGATRTTIIQKDDKRTNKEGNEKVLIEKGNQDTEIKVGDQSTTIDAGNYNLDVHQDWTTAVEAGNYSLMVQTGSHSTQVKGDTSLLVAKGSYSGVIKTGDALVTVGQGSAGLKVNTGNVAVLVKSGDMITKLSGGKYLVKSEVGIKFQVGENSITIGQEGVVIKGLNVKMEGQMQATVKGLNTQITGDCMLKAGGAMTMIG